jgi:alpha-tubulin suppressor-like RCC1 family protein
VIDVAAGRDFSVVLIGNGSLMSWGSKDLDVRKFLHNTSDAVVIGVGSINTVIGYRDGRIIAYGTSNFGALITRTLTRTSMPTLTASETLIPTNSLTPSKTKTIQPPSP